MGKVFWILVWDSWGCGLDMVAPRLFEIFDEDKIIRRNSFFWEKEDDINKFIEAHKIEERFGDYYKVITL